MKQLPWIAWAVFAAFGLGDPAARGQIDFEREPINYHGAAHHDPAAALTERLERGEARLDYDGERGYLPALLEALGLSRSSQTLVFSKTSFQRSRISPKRPRALYFNDDNYVGWVQGGDVIEITSVDPRLGPIFYTLDQARVERPRLIRQTDECLQCHASSMTDGVPGHLVRSIFPGPTGLPVLSAGSHRTTYQSPLEERWGGWYVTGTHGRTRHMGNVVLKGRDPEQLDRAGGANVTDLSARLDVTPYLSPHSDIVALMVLEHQVPTHNRIVSAHYQALLAEREQRALNELAGVPASSPIESIERRFRYAAEDLLRCLLFAGETPLNDPVRGTSGFAEHFAALGPHDARGRSLRQFDLQKRLFKYPCSYLIYSPAFDALPESVRSKVYERLWQILTGPESPPEYAHLSAADRRAIREILIETKSGLPSYWTRR